MSSDAGEVEGLVPALDTLDTVAFVSRYISLFKEANHHSGLCPFHDEENGSRSLRIYENAWRCAQCGSHEIAGADHIGFYACWTNTTRAEAAAALGNGAGLPDAKPVTQVPLKRLPFWGWRHLDRLPGKAVWIHELSGAVLVWRELVPERVHLGLIHNGKWDDLSIVAKRKVVLVPENNPAGRAKMQLLAAALYRSGHEKVMCLNLGIDPEFGTRELPPPGEDVIKWAKARSKAYPKLGEPDTDNAAPQVNEGEGRRVAPEGLLGDSMPQPAGAAPQLQVSHKTAGLTASNAAPQAQPDGSPVAPAIPGRLEEAAPDDRWEPAQDALSPRGNGPAIDERPSGKGNGRGTPITPLERAEGHLDQAKAEVLGSMVYRRASTVTLRATDWLWPGKIPLGEICVIQGDPGLGKSQITASIAAIITRGGQWPLTREPCSVGSVIILSAEDSMAKTIVPRLAAAGADLERVTILQAMKFEHGTRGFSLLADLTALDALIGEEDNPMAVIVDPISAYQDTVGVGAKTHDSHKNVDVRSLLRPVSELVDRRNITVILINHLTKGTGRAITRGQGNMAFVAGPRAVWQVSKDKDDPRKRLFLPVKNNLADDSEGTGLSFGVEPIELGHDAQGKPISTSRILWNDERVTITADEAAGYDSLSQDERGSVNEAQDFLRETLADGRVKVKDIESQAKSSGHSHATLGRAKRALGIISEREGFGREAVYYWKLKE